MKHKERHTTVQVIENEAVFFGGYICAFWAKFALYTRTLFLISTPPPPLPPPVSDCPINSDRKFAPDHLVPTYTHSVDVNPKWPHVPLPVIPETAGAATAQVQVC